MRGPRVAADVRKDSRESTLQMFPCRMCRVAIERRHIRFLKSNATARPCQLDGFMQESFRITGSACHETGMYQIEAAGWKTGVVDITQHKFDVRETARVRVLASVVEKDRVGIETDDCAGRANTHAQKIRYAPRTTAQIEAAPSPSRTNAVQHNRCVWSKHVTLDQQPVNLAGAPLDRVHACGHRP